MRTERGVERMPRKAAVLGKPVAHSLSPILHESAYRALRLTEWTYQRIEVDADGLPELVAGLDRSWVGLSVTMPCKRSALEVADEITERAAAVGAANTLVRNESGRWLADCTDVDGVVGALRGAAGFVPAQGSSGVILGAGGTAAAAVIGLSALGIRHVRVVVRDPARAAGVCAAARRAGVEFDVLRWSEVDFLDLASDASVVVSTVPADASAEHAVELAQARCLLDVVYHPWPTALAEAVQARGANLATGLDMLLHQAFGQVEHFTGMSAPRTSMRESLREATGRILPLPIE